MSRRRWGAAAAACAVLGLVPAVASANVQVGSSGWLWGNPLPQGNTLRAMSFAGTTGYAVGDFGTLLKTTDGGSTWSGTPAGTFSNLTELQVLDANTLVAGGGCVARLSTDGGASFSRIILTPVESSCPDDSKLAALSFRSADMGYVVSADGAVTQTSDRGVTFAVKVAVPGTKRAGGGAVPTDLLFVSDTKGFATTSDGKIYVTNDGAASWTPVNDTNRPVTAITMVDDKVGYAVGGQSLFLKTTDGGATWSAKDVGAPAPQDLTSVRCISADVCVATTAQGKQLVRTVDGGGTFTFPSPSTDPLYAAGFASPTRLVAVGQSGATVTSDDAGATFATVSRRLTGTFTRIRPGLVAGSAFAPGPDGTLGRTVDGGHTWTAGTVTTSEDVRDVSFPTADAGFALDTAGGLFGTTTGGATWKGLDTGTTARPGAVYAPNANTVLLIGPTGIRRSTDAGGSFAAIKGKPVSPTQLGEVDRAGSGAIIAYGRQAVLRSTDKGKTWKELKKPGKYVKKGKKKVNTLGIRLVDFTDAKNGFLMDSSGRLWRTKNAGESWSELTGTGTSPATWMAFSSTQKGYLVISTFGDVRTPTGFVLRTSDGGATWHPQFVESEPIPYGGVATGSGADYLLGGSSALLYSNSGGDFGGKSDLTITAPKTKYSKPVGITVTGKLKPASGGERVTVSWRRPGSTSWQSQTTKAAANGAFTTSWRPQKGTNLFVAQWAGDFRSQGDGSKVLTITVGSSKKK
jgi:photosystem II stability/assembly factor-like uncharacterized protein